MRCARLSKASRAFRTCAGLDQDHDGTVSVKEFVTKMCEAVPYAQKDDLASLFKQIDKDDSGQLTVSELKKVLQPEGQTSWVDVHNLPKFELPRPTPLKDDLRKHVPKAMELYKSFEKERGDHVPGASGHLNFAANAKTAHLDKLSFSECLELYFPKSTHIKRADLNKLSEWVEETVHYNKSKAEWLATLRPEQRTAVVKAMRDEASKLDSPR
jgi:hypothetical protein